MWNRDRQPADNEETNLTDVNNGGAATDEDGALEQEHNDSDVNSAPEGDEVEEEDSTPIISALSMRSYMQDGKEYTEVKASAHFSAIHADEETEVETTAVVKDEAGRVQVDENTGKVMYEKKVHKHFAVIRAGGIAQKRLVLPGNVTALQLAQHIFAIEKW